MPLPKRPYQYEKIEGVLPRAHPLYSTWHGMMVRCYDESRKSYTRYGARGITVCKEWWTFQGFFRDMGNKPSPDHTLERVNNQKGYSKSNCVWATRSEQCSNRNLFVNSTTGHEGVSKLKNGTFVARLNYEGVRYNIGRFLSLEAAVIKRTQFKTLFKENKELAISSIKTETVWNTSSTGIRGITAHPDGGFMVRKTVDGKRIYVGYFKTLKEAIHAKRR